MAKGAYIGIADIARKIKKGYIGVNGIAKKIKKAYVGDESGRARLCYTAAAVWKKYEAVSNTRYEQSVASNVSGINSNVGTYEKWYYSASGFTFSETTGNYSLKSASSLQGTAIPVAAANDYFKNAYVIMDSSSGKTMYYNCTKYNNAILTFAKKYTAEETVFYSRGQYIEDVENDNETAYPDDGYQDGYWYVKQK